MLIGARIADAVKSQYAQTNKSIKDQNFPLVLSLQTRLRAERDLSISRARCRPLRYPVNSRTRFSTNAIGNSTNPSVNTSGTGVSRKEIKPGNCTEARTTSDKTSG